MFKVIGNSIVKAAKKAVAFAGTKTGKVVIGGTVVAGVGAITAAVLGKSENEEPMIEVTGEEMAEETTEETETEPEIIITEE